MDSAIKLSYLPVAKHCICVFMPAFIVVRTVVSLSNDATGLATVSSPEMRILKRR